MSTHGKRMEREKSITQTNTRTALFWLIFFPCLAVVVFGLFVRHELSLVSLCGGGGGGETRTHALNFKSPTQTLSERARARLPSRTRVSTRYAISSCYHTYIYINILYVFDGPGTGTGGEQN